VTFDSIDGMGATFYTPAMDLDVNISTELRRCWGYDSFRPLQERIVRSLLERHDVCVVMPTGGGKSLCYQLPAAMMGAQTAIVVSPLIALMQDQVAQLEQMGIPAAMLNSSLAASRQNEIIRQASEGKYRLLYLSPERLAREDSLAWLSRVPISFFAIDEAHCISEWGHEFRPDYRLLSRLRTHFPDCPIAAFTASATQRVRHDIIEQLHLREPHKFIASFHRPNLRYIVKACDTASQPELLLSALREHAGSNVIIYAPTIKRVEQTVEVLKGEKIRAIPYHGQMDADSRRINQERWMSDDVRVLVATIAFGLGINKAAVRAVIHLSLPKSIEQFYQEAGRAGRDGQPSDCLLLWQKRDAGLLAHFIGQIEDQSEKQRAWQRYHMIRDFCEAKVCRHRQICIYFGESPKWMACGACDICAPEPDWLTPDAGRTREVRPEATRKRKADPGPVSARAAREHGSGTSDGADAANPELREYLREWRKLTANERKVPAFIIMHDTSLDELCQRPPRTLDDVAATSGFGEKKTASYGQAILDAVARFRQGARAMKAGDQDG
jgi:ATP-dependent DNA helicase RecQ